MHNEDLLKLKLIAQVIEEAKKVKKLGGGKVRFVTFDEKKFLGGKDERQERKMSEMRTDV